jgi:hypothetical protein
MLETALAENTAALKEAVAALNRNTEAHEKLAAVAVKAQSAKAAEPTREPYKTAAEPEKAAEKPAEKPATKPAAEKPAAEKPAAEKPAAKPAAKPTGKKGKQPPALVAEVTSEALRDAAKAFLSSDDAAVRDGAKGQMSAAFNHLGAAKLSDLDDEGRAKLAGYIAYWSAGLDVNFEEIDEKIAALADENSEGDEGGEGDDESMLD